MKAATAPVNRADEYIAEYMRDQWRKNWEHLPHSQRMPRLGCFVSLASGFCKLEFRKAYQNYFQYGERIEVADINMEPL